MYECIKETCNNKKIEVNTQYNTRSGWTLQWKTEGLLNAHPASLEVLYCARFGMTFISYGLMHISLYWLQ